jgi:hydroxypyruvate isomerase
MVTRRHFLGAAASASLAQVSNLQQIGRATQTKFAVNVEVWWKALPFLERLERATELGFPAIELWSWRDKDLDAIAVKAKELGLAVTQFTAWGFEPGMNNPVNHDAVEREIEAACLAAKKLGATAMTVVAGNDQPGMTQEEMHGHVIAALKRVAPIAERSDVTLILEPIW